MHYLLVYVESYLIIQMCVVWIFFYITKNPIVVDVAWPMGLMISGLIYLFSALINLRMGLIALLLMMWSIRLALYLWIMRVRKNYTDKRYLEISERWKINKSLGFFINFHLQGLCIFIISLIFFFISRNLQAKISFLDTLGIFLSLLGIIGETIADFQLHLFKKKHVKEVCDVGLWKYSRHPNYFFDWLTFCGFTLFALGAPHGYLSLIPLAGLYLIFTRITGPITERVSIQSRGEKYIIYQQTTSMFFLWRKRGCSSNPDHQAANSN